MGREQALAGVGASLKTGVVVEKTEKGIENRGVKRATGGVPDIAWAGTMPAAKAARRESKAKDAACFYVEFTVPSL